MSRKDLLEHVRWHGITLPDRAEDVSAEDVDAVNRRLNASSGSLSTQARAAWIRLVVERAAVSRTRPGFLASTGLLVAWASCVFAALIAFVLSARGAG